MKVHPPLDGCYPSGLEHFEAAGGKLPSPGIDNASSTDGLETQDPMAMLLQQPESESDPSLDELSDPTVKTSHHYCVII